MSASCWVSLRKPSILCVGMSAWLAVIASAWLADAMAAETRSSSLVVAGSGSNVPITRLLAEAFRRIRPDITIEVPASIGSGGATRAAADGAIALGLISRPLRDKEQGWGLTVLPYARTAVIIGTHPTVAEDKLTFDELVLVYRGVKTRWSDGHEIVVLTREPGDSSLEVLEREIPGFLAASAEAHRTRRWKTLYTDQEMTRMLAQTPYALGPTDLGTVAAERLPIKALELNGFAPAREDVGRGRYPLVKTLAFVFRGDRPSANAQAFLDFVRGPVGAKILQANGYVREE